jgi:hypothetical protein
LLPWAAELYVSVSYIQGNQMVGSHLCIIIGISGTAIPGTDPDVCFAICKGTDELFKLGKVLGGTDANNFAILNMYTVLQAILGPLARLLPCSIKALHEPWVSLAGLVLANLLDDHVASGTADVAHVDEVVAHVSAFGDLGLFTNLAIMDGDDGTGRAIFCFDVMFLVCFDNDVLVVIPAMDLEALVVAGHVADNEGLDSHLDNMNVL